MQLVFQNVAEVTAHAWTDLLLILKTEDKQHSPGSNHLHSHDLLGALTARGTCLCIYKGFLLDQSINFFFSVLYSNLMWQMSA